MPGFWTRFDIKGEMNMKKWLLITIILSFVLVLSACGKESENNVAAVESGVAAHATGTAPEETQAPSAEADVFEPSMETSAEWPAALDDWGVPKPENANITAVEDKSMTDGVLTQGVNFIVNLSDVTKQSFDNYCAVLESQGFDKNPDSLADIMLVYNKAVSGGELKLTLSYSDSSMTLIANNSAAAAQKEEQSGGSADWPESVKGIPEFTKGTYKETVEMGGGMYAITYTGITESDLDWYRETLTSAGFISQEEADTEGYAKFDADMAYSVGFFLEGDTLQIIVLSGSF
jgi:hypothetical protein